MCDSYCPRHRDRDHFYDLRRSMDPLKLPRLQLRNRHLHSDNPVNRATRRSRDHRNRGADDRGNQERVYRRLQARIGYGRCHCFRALDEDGRLGTLSERGTWDEAR